MDDWEGFLETCESKEYESCAVVIDGQAYRNVGIRAKGNNSLSSVAACGNHRYSFKVEFDHYDDTKNDFGLDKISLTSLIQDNTMMKDYLVYQMMAGFGVDAPLCSYAYITVNGEDWGLYLAVEGVEESFLRRNYGSSYGSLYKPDGMNQSGERGGQPGGGDDVKLRYQDDDPDSYPNIFNNAKTDVSAAAAVDKRGGCFYTNFQSNPLHHDCFYDFCGSQHPVLGRDASAGHTALAKSDPADCGKHREAEAVCDQCGA